MRATLTLYGREMKVVADFSRLSPTKLTIHKISLDDILFIRNKMKELIEKPSNNYKTDGSLVFDPIYYQGTFPTEIGEMILDPNVESVSTELTLSADWWTYNKEDDNGK